MNYSSHIENKNIILSIYQSNRTVFSLADIAMLSPGLNASFLSQRMSYYVKTNKLVKLRQGIYAKPKYQPLELANILYTPSYISLEYVLQQAGAIFQYSQKITCASYLSRELNIDANIYQYRRLKPEILLNPLGINQNEGLYNIASPERAFLDLLYLNKDFYLDFSKALDQSKVLGLLPLYNSVTLEKRTIKTFENA